jgi:hypothetical protein
MIIRYYDTLVLLSTERTCCFTWAGAGREHHFSILVERTDLLFDIGSHCHFHVVDSCLHATTSAALKSTATRSVSAQHLQQEHHMILTNSVHSIISLCAVLPGNHFSISRKHQYTQAPAQHNQTSTSHHSLNLHHRQQRPPYTTTQTVKMVEPLTMIVIPLAVTFSAIICAGAVQKRWQLRNVDDGNKYNRLARKSRRFRQLVTGRPVTPKFECDGNCYLIDVEAEDR